MDEMDVLYVEDHPTSVRLLREAFQESGVSARVHTARSAPEALAFLARDGPHADAPVPDLVVLDLDLGGTSGFDVLESMRDRRDVPAPPAVLFTSSEDDSDVVAARERGADAFVRKPDDFEGLIAFANRTTRFLEAARTSREAA